MTTDEIGRLQAYLHEIHNETTPISLHVFGEPPPDKLLVPWLVTCLGAGFLDALGEVVEVPRAAARTPGSRQKYLRAKAEETLKPFVLQRLSVRGGPTSRGLRGRRRSVAAAAPRRFRRRGSFRKVSRPHIRSSTTCWRPWPGGSSCRGRETAPTATRAWCPPGRNMYVMNPEEVPSPPSWEIGKQLVEQLLAQQLKTKGRYPRRWPSP